MSLRIGDAEREEANHALGEHFAAGRLDRAEYDERSEAALRARTWDDITPLFADLPAPVAGPPAPAPAQSRRSSPTPRRRRFGGVPVPLLVLLVLVVLFQAPWLLAIGLGFFLFSRFGGPHRHGSWHSGPHWGHPPSPR